MSAALRSGSALTALGLLLSLFILAGCSSGDDAAEDAAVPTSPDEVLESPDGGEGDVASKTVEPLKRTAVKLYYPSNAGNYLVAETHEIFETASPSDRAKQILADLIAGPNAKGSLPCLPRDVRLRQVFVLEDGTAWVDFSSELRSSLRGGSQNELLTVYAIVDSLAFNIVEVRRVGILIEGRQIETLNGHIDMSRPFRPDAKWVGRQASRSVAPATPLAPGGYEPGGSSRSIVAA